jgi:hypothetical protein
LTALFTLHHRKDHHLIPTTMPPTIQKIPLPRQKACKSCAASKVRCDHRSPCARCYVRGQPCEYQAPTPRHFPAAESNTGAQPYDEKSARPEDRSHNRLLESCQERDIQQVPAGDIDTPWNVDTSLREPTVLPEVCETSMHDRIQVLDEILICNIDAAAISCRWLHAFTTNSDDSTKTIPPGLNVYIGKMLKSYTSRLR